MELELLAERDAFKAAIGPAIGVWAVRHPQAGNSSNRSIDECNPFGHFDRFAASRIRTAFRSLISALKPYPVTDGASPNFGSTRFDHMANLTI